MPQAEVCVKDFALHNSPYAGGGRLRGEEATAFAVDLRQGIAKIMSIPEDDRDAIKLDPDQVTLKVFVEGEKSDRWREFVFLTTSAATIKVWGTDWQHRVARHDELQDALGLLVKTLLDTDKHVESKLRLEPKKNESVV